MTRQAPRIAAVLFLSLACSRGVDRITLHDDIGRPVALPHRVQRVVTLAPNLTEIVFAAGAGDRIVAADDFSDTPPAARRLPKVGGLQPNLERIAAARPDLVLATTNGNHAAIAPALASLRVPLFVVRTDRLSEVPTAIERIGTILTAPDAQRVATSLRRSIEAQRRRRRVAPRVLFAVWVDPLYVAGKNTFSDDLLLLTGAANVVTVNGWPQLALETVIASPPDLILYPDKSVTSAQLEALLQRAPELRQRSRLVAVDENLFTRPGPRVAEAAARLNGILDSWQKSR